MILPKNLLLIINRNFLKIEKQPNQVIIAKGNMYRISKEQKRKDRSSNRIVHTLWINIRNTNSMSEEAQVT